MVSARPAAIAVRETIVRQGSLKARVERSGLQGRPIPGQRDPAGNPRRPGHRTKKHQKSSDVGSVKTVQQAFWDLDWPYRIHLLDKDGNQIPHDVSVDGDYGPGTEKVVVAFKRRYNIHYPPTDPEGLVDGIRPSHDAAARRECRVLELVSSSIVLKRAQLDGAGIITTPWDRASTGRR